MTRAALLLPLIAICLAGPAPADSVSVAVGSDRVTGEVLGYDGTILRLATAAGEVSLIYDPALCDGAACPAVEDFVPTLRFSGSARLGTLILPALVEGYAREAGLAVDRIDEGPQAFRYEILDAAGPVLHLPFRLTTTGDGLADLLAGEADIAMAGRLPDVDEVERARAAGLGDLPDRMRLLALEPVQPAVAPTSSLSALDPADLGRLVSGEVTDWATLGLPPGAVHLHQVESDDEIGALLERLAPGAAGAERPELLHVDAVAQSDAIAADPDGFGLLPAAGIGLAHALPLRGGCGIALEPGGGAVAAGDYPLVLPLALVVPRRHLHPAAQAFVDWTGTEAALGVIRRAGVSAPAPVPMPVAAQGDRLVAAILAAGPVPQPGLDDLQRFARFARDKVRLSTTVRFDAAEEVLSRARLVALAEGIAAGRPDERTLWLVGFTRGEGEARANLALGRQRAVEVRDRLVALFDGALPEGTVVRTASFGEVLPVACDDSPQGQELNDRVEIWTTAD